MTPRDTVVRLVNPGGEWNRLYAMAKRAGGKVHKGDFAFPTVVAVRNGEIVGFVATQPNPDAVVAGPLVIDGGPNIFIFLRLAEGYENVLRLAGVKTYLHVIDKGRDEHVQMMERLGFVRWGLTEDGDTLMRRDLT